MVGLLGFCVWYPQFAQLCKWFVLTFSAHVCTHAITLISPVSARLHSQTLAWIRLFALLQPVQFNDHCHPFLGVSTGPLRLIYVEYHTAPARTHAHARVLSRPVSTKPNWHHHQHPNIPTSGWQCYRLHSREQHVGTESANTNSIIWEKRRFIPGTSYYSK